MRKYLGAIIGSGALAVIALALLTFHKAFDPEIDTVALTTILVCSIVALVAVIAVVAAIYNWLGLTDTGQALALPDGSVRSIIALLLIVIFAMLAMFFYEGLSGTTTTLTHQTEANVIAFINKNPGAPSLTITPESAVASAAATNSATNGIAPANALGAGGEAPEKAGPATLYTITYGATSAAASDFAKQLMAALQALLTTVVGFYFGAKTATSSAAAAAQQFAPSPAPDPRGITPSSVASDPAGSVVGLTIQGPNLNSIVHAQVQSAGKPPVALTDVLSNPTQVTGKLAVTSGMKGPWDVVLVDGAGKTWSLPAALTIT